MLRIKVQSLVVRKKLKKRLEELSKKFPAGEIPYPEFWGGYAVTPFEYEFFQGQKWRLNDRLLYTLDKDAWKRVRLSP